MKEKIQNLIKKHTTKKRILVYLLSGALGLLSLWLNTWIWDM
jgi:hypothetical protein